MGWRSSILVDQVALNHRFALIGYHRLDILNILGIHLNLNFFLATQSNQRLNEIYHTVADRASDLGGCNRSWRWFGGGINLDDLCRACAVQTEFVMAMLEEGVAQPAEGQLPTTWRFSEVQVQRVTVAWRLQRDLGVNPAGQNSAA